MECTPQEAERLLALPRLHLKAVHMLFDAYVEEEERVASCSDAVLAAIGARAGLEALSLTDASLAVKRGAFVDLVVRLKIKRLTLTNTSACTQADSHLPSRY